MPEPIVSMLAQVIGISSAAAQVLFILASLVLIRVLLKFTLSENWTVQESKTYNLLTKVRIVLTTIVYRVIPKADLRVSFAVPTVHYKIHSSL